MERTDAMRRIICLFLCMICLTAFTMEVFALNDCDCCWYEETQLENGIIIIDEIYIYHTARSLDKTVVRKKSVKDGDTLIAVIAISGVFRYDGSTVAVLSKSVTQCDTYESWEYSQKSFKSENGTIKLSAKLTKYVIMNMTFTMTLTCDKDGNISST